MGHKTAPRRHGGRKGGSQGKGRRSVRADQIGGARKSQACSGVVTRKRATSGTLPTVRLELFLVRQASVRPGGGMNVHVREGTAQGRSPNGPERIHGPKGKRGSGSVSFCERENFASE